MTVDITSDFVNTNARTLDHRGDGVLARMGVESSGERGSLGLRVCNLISFVAACVLNALGSTGVPQERMHAFTLQHAMQ